jgi:hypothetical protein
VSEPAYQPDPGPLAEPAPAPAPADPARQQVDDAIREASRMLYAYPGCLNTISGREPGNGEDALTVLSRLNEGRFGGGDGKLLDHGDQSGPLGAPASVPEGAIGAGSNARIDLYRQFHDDPTADDFYRAFGDHQNRPLVDAMFAAFGGPPSPTEWRALILLHEVMHLTGSLPGDHYDNAGFENFNSVIFMNCVRAGVNPNSGGGASPEPQPVPAPTAPAVGPTTGAADGGGDLPTSDDPVIDFGSDDPVITGEDGTPIDGGDVGEAYGDPAGADAYGDPCYPYGCVDDDLGDLPYDPGYGGGGGPDFPGPDEDWWYYLAEEFAY